MPLGNFCFFPLRTKILFACLLLLCQECLKPKKGIRSFEILQVCPLDDTSCFKRWRVVPGIQDLKNTSGGAMYCGTGGDDLGLHERDGTKQHVLLTVMPKHSTCIVRL